MKLKDKVAIITGATSGMGRATAVLFAKEGAKVMITGRNEKRAKEVVDQIKAKGGEAHYVLADTSKLDNVPQIVDKTLELHKTVDILFNNAGQLSITPLLDVKMDEWLSAFNVNVNSALLLAQLVAPIMKKKGKGVIINNASVAGFHAHHGTAAYVTSKHAMIGLNKSMAWELGPEIRVNGIAPGAIVTAMLDSVGGEAAAEGLRLGSPLKRVGQSEEIARAALFLAADDSSFITGQMLRVDGGIDI